MIGRTNKIKKDVALRLLEETAAYYAVSNCKNDWAIQNARQASILLGSRKLRKFFTERLNSIDYKPIRGVITNIPRERLSSTSFEIKLLTKREVKRKYPVFSVSYLGQIVKLYPAEHITLCFEGKFDAAMQVASKSKTTKDFHELETVSAIAVSGNPSLALEMSSRLARKDELMMILVIEFFRNNQQAEALKLLDKVKEGKNFYLYSAADMAIGIMNYIPWVIYPFPDY